MVFWKWYVYFLDKIEPQRSKTALIDWKYETVFQRLYSINLLYIYWPLTLSKRISIFLPSIFKMNSENHSLVSSFLKMSPNFLYSLVLMVDIKIFVEGDPSKISMPFYELVDVSTKSTSFPIVWTSDNPYSEQLPAHRKTT